MAKMLSCPALLENGGQDDFYPSQHRSCRRFRAFGEARRDGRQFAPDVRSAVDPCCSGSPAPTARSAGARPGPIRRRRRRWRARCSRPPSSDATPPRRGRPGPPWPGRLGYDRRGISVMTLGGLDVALWDLAGRIADAPVHALLGGKLRDRLPAYASGPFMKTGGGPPIVISPPDIDGYLQAGFRAIKLRMGHEPIRDGAVARAVRAQIGAAMPLMVDLNEGFQRRRRRGDRPAPHGGRSGLARRADRPRRSAGDIAALARECPIRARRRARRSSACAAFAIIWPPASSTSSSPDLGLCGRLHRGDADRGGVRRLRGRGRPACLGLDRQISRRRSTSPPVCKSGAAGSAGPLFEYDPSEKSAADGFRLTSARFRRGGGGAGRTRPRARTSTPSTSRPFITDQWTIR